MESRLKKLPTTFPPIGYSGAKNIENSGSSRRYQVQLPLLSTMHRLVARRRLLVPWTKKPCSDKYPGGDDEESYSEECCYHRDPYAPVPRIVGSMTAYSVVEVNLVCKVGQRREAHDVAGHQYRHRSAEGLSHLGWHRLHDNAPPEYRTLAGEV